MNPARRCWLCLGRPGAYLADHQGRVLVPLSLLAVCVNRGQGPIASPGRVASRAVHTANLTGSPPESPCCWSVGAAQASAPGADDLATVGGGRHSRWWTAG
jgi:hypothetical protein